MRKEKSWTRRDYEATYRQLRRGIDCDWLFTTEWSPEKIIRAADYSYQARDYHVHGWTSGLRRVRFNAVKVRILVQREVYPW